MTQMKLNHLNLAVNDVQGTKTFLEKYFGLKAMECGWITDRQIEAARIAMTRSIKRGGKVWIRLFPDKPITKKPAETRMGKGKGAPEQWVGHDGILISLEDRHDESEGYAEYFRRIEPLGAFPMTRHGNPFRTVRLYRCVEQIKPFPFRVVRRAP